MIKKYKDYILLLGIFLLVIFSGSLNNFLTMLNPHLKTTNIDNNYNTYLEKELNELETLNELKTTNLNLTISRIKYKDIYDFMNTITIYKGYKNKVNVNDAVLTDKGIIGVVSKTYDYYSIVRLITNNDSNISVRINESLGILKYIDNKLIVTDINNYENIKEGSSIYTSGYGNIVRDIYVGKVKKITLNSTEIEKIVEVELDNDFNNLNYVYIWRQ